MLQNLFHDLRDLDPDCKAYYLRADSGLAAVSIGVSACLVPPMAYLDYYYYSLSADFFLSVVFEALFAALTVVIALVIRRTGSVRAYERLALTWLFITSVFAFFITAAQPQRVTENIEFGLLFLVANFMTIQNRFLYRIIPTAIIYGAVLTALATNRSWSDFPEKYMLTLLLLMLTVVGILVVARNNRFKRSTFALQKSEREARLRYESLAMTDPLTGVPNRRYFQEQVAQEWNRFKRHASVFSVAVTDLDRFKTFNDTYGHAVGDEVLKLFAVTIATQARALDFYARIGGEEFGFLFRETHGNGAVTALGRLRDRLRKATMPAPRVGLSITFSAGIAEVRAEDRSFEDTIQRADKAMYRAKENGRDRIETG